jgi:hypothetical protein
LPVRRLLGLRQPIGATRAAALRLRVEEQADGGWQVLLSPRDGRAVRENQARVLKFFFHQSPDLLLKVRHTLPTLSKP